MSSYVLCGGKEMFVFIKVIYMLLNHAVDIMGYKPYETL